MGAPREFVMNEPGIRRASAKRSSATTRPGKSAKTCPFARLQLKGPAFLPDLSYG
jgi:hypothetical protein